MLGVIYVYIALYNYIMDITQLLQSGGGTRNIGV